MRMLYGKVFRAEILHKTRYEKNEIKNTEAQRKERETTITGMKGT
jgi:hypothetical protein